MVYTPQPIEEVDVAALHVDSQNFRIADQQPSEPAIMNYLYDIHNVFDVAKLILRDGYIDNELPIVVHEDGRYVIIEGNRRLTALRTLIDPSLAPSHQADITRLLRRYSTEASDLPTRIRVMVLPDRASVAPVLARLHIGASKKAWDLDEQAKFVLAQLSDGATVQQLKDELPAIKDVPRLVKMGRVRQVLNSATFSDPAIDEYAARKLRMSAFEYAYRNPLIQLAIGLQFDRDGNLLSEPSTPAHGAALERLVVLFQTNKLSTRKFPKTGTAAFVKLLGDIAGIPVEDTGSDLPDIEDPTDPRAEDQDVDSAQLPDTADTCSESVPDAGPADDGVDGERSSSIPIGTDQDVAGNDTVAVDADENAPRKPRGPSYPDKKNRLNMAGIDYSHAPTGIQKRLIELSGIDVVRFPAAAAMLLRSILESSIKDHYAQRQQSVNGMLGVVAKKLADDYGKVPEIRRQVGLLSGGVGKGVGGSIDWFNQVSHNPAMHVEAPAVHQAWQEMMALVRYLLRPP